MRKTILITGASSGLGAEMARQFAAKGMIQAGLVTADAGIDLIRTTGRRLVDKV